MSFACPTQLVADPAAPACKECDLEITPHIGGPRVERLETLASLLHPI
jgi:hypothetical protein